jgi:hypothetical protein
LLAAIELQAEAAKNAAVRRNPTSTMKEKQKQKVSDLELWRLVSCVNIDSPIEGDLAVRIPDRPSSMDSP